MVIPWLGLHDFRNYQTLDLCLEPGLNLIHGHNGQGKTNLIEALYLLTHLRSYRAQRLRPLLRAGQAEARVSGVIEADQVRHKINLDIFPQNKRVEVDGKALQLSSDYIQKFFSLLFAPDLLSRFKEFPAERRSFFDRALCLLDPGYFSRLKEFERLKAQKNKNLKERSTQTIATWNQMLAHVIPSLVSARNQLVDDLNLIMKDFYQSFYETEGSLAVVYKSDCKSATAEQVLQILEQKQIIEQEQGFCVVGPHKDNYQMTMETKVDRLGFSQGEYRLAFLALLLSLNQVFWDRLQYRPILLFDDLFSELDEKTCTSLMAYFEVIENQIIITSTEVPGRFQQTKGQFRVEKAQVFVNT